MGRDLQQTYLNKTFTNALIAVGSNISVAESNPRNVVAQAVEAVAIRAQATAKMSQIYRTPAFPDPSDPSFANAAFAIDWQGSAGDLLTLLHAVEAEFGRIRSERWQARSLDLDLIAFGQTVLPDEATQTAWRALSTAQAAAQAPDTLILPHPRLQERGFVLVPLMDIAPDWRHPVLGQTIREMHASLPASETAAITPW